MSEKTSNTYVIGDIHGSYKALLQCLSLASFDYEIDHLIVLGDICDGFPQTKECMDELLKIKNCHLVLGNHDQWALDWMLTGEKPKIWTMQGGAATLKSFGETNLDKYKKFLLSGSYYLEWRDKLFVHGGINQDLPINKQDNLVLLWDRRLIEDAWHCHEMKESVKFGGYDEIFVGHTSTEQYRSKTPLHYCNVWMLDTGAGWSGKLTIMNVDTYKYWQSDCSANLYKDF